jgi:hypothetical protein
MRRIALGLVILGTALGASCKPPPKEKLDDLCKQAIQLYFDVQNQEAQDRKESLAKEKAAAAANPALKPPTGFTYSYFDWKLDGFIVEGFKCQVCGTKMLLPVAAQEYLCRSCGHSPYRQHVTADYKDSPCKKCLPGGKVAEPGDLASREQFAKHEGAKVKDMYEEASHNKDKGILKVKVRYIRRAYVFDERAVVPLSNTVVTKAAVPMEWIPTEGGEKWSRAGFHRADGEYVGEIHFQFDGALTKLWESKEEPVRMWRDIRRDVSSRQ